MKAGSNETGVFDQPDSLREFLFTVLESLPSGILLADRSGTLIAVNQKAAAILGVAGKSIQNMTIWDLLTAEFHIAAEKLALLQEPGGKILFETNRNHQHGSRKYLTISRNELKSPFLHISGFFLAIEDVTYMILVEAQAMRHKRLTAMQEMAVNMSQEIKNPLGGIALYGSILQRELAADHDNLKMVKQMMRAAHTIDFLLDNYITFAEMPAPHFDRIVVQEWLADAVRRLVEQSSADHRISLICNDPEMTVYGDIDLLRQMVVNLGINALQSMPGGGIFSIKTQILLTGQSSRPFLEITFSDSGEGIAAENLEKIFDPFFTSRAKANGLGLAIVHYIVEVHNGFINVDSSPENGTIITVLLPY